MIDLLFDSWFLLGVTTLKKYKEERQYGDAANLLEGLNEVILHFQSYSEIPQIKDLALQVKGLQNEFGDQIINFLFVFFLASTPFDHLKIQRWDTCGLQRPQRTHRSHPE